MVLNVSFVRQLPLAISIAAVSSLSTAETATQQEKKDTNSIEEMHVIGHQNQPNFEATELTGKLLKTPGTLGDPLQAVFSLPGVVQVDEEDGEPAVRGSSPRANLFLIDGLPSSFIFHDFGNSIFNENLIHDFGFKSAGFGARYGKATGAVFDVKLRDPKNQPLETTVDLSLLRAGVMGEGRVTENQSFYLSLRQSLIQHFIGSDEEDGVKFTSLPKATDYQGKYLWQLENGNSLTFSINGASSKASANFSRRAEEVLLDPGLEGSATLNRGFNNQSLSWRSPHSTLILGHTKNTSNQKVGNGEFLDLSEDRWVLKGERNWQFGDHQLALGGNMDKREYDYNMNLRLERCSDFSPGCEFDRRDAVATKRVQDVTTYEAFAEDRWAINSDVELVTGVHLTRDDYLKETHVDPRLSASWKLTDNWTLNGSVGRYHQAPDEQEIFPVIGNPNLNSISSTHYVIGVDHNFDDDSAWFDSSWSWSAEVYYKDIDNLVVNTTNDAIPFVNQGTGKAYGAEFMINKDITDRWYGWMTASWSKTERTNKLTGQSTPFSYDVPLVINMVANYQWTETWNVGFRWTYRSGSPYTPIIGNRENPQFPGFYIPVYGQLNSQRASAYHRLDVRFERPLRSFLQGSFYVDIINLYGRKNTSGIDYTPVAGSSEFRLEETESFGLFPSVGVKFTF